MKRQYILFLRDILQAIIHIEKFTSGTDLQTFLKDEKTKSAVVWQISIIGESAKHIPRSIRQKYTDIPWSEMARMRDKITHSYFRIRYEIVWGMITKRLPEIRSSIQTILNNI